MDWSDLEALLTDDHRQGQRLRHAFLTDVRLGQILTRTGVLTDTELESALDLQRAASGLLGEILVQLGYCTPGQISWALGCQYAETRLGQMLLKSRTLGIEELQSAYLTMRAEGDTSLPEVLIREGYVTPEKLEALMAVQYQEAKLGQILLVSGVLTEQQLAAGLSRQKETGERLGEALRALGHCQDEDIDAALQKQLQS
ncbi:MAG TPA: hypothetical protein V6D05_10430 [Stenomitos sp.]